VCKEQTTWQTIVPGQTVKAGEVRIVERCVSPHASDIEMMQRVKDELEDLKTA
jgi:hypothetical protein